MRFLRVNRPIDPLFHQFHSTPTTKKHVPNVCRVPWDTRSPLFSLSMSLGVESRTESQGDGQKTVETSRQFDCSSVRPRNTVRLENEACARIFLTDFRSAKICRVISKIAEGRRSTPRKKLFFHSSKKREGKRTCAEDSKEVLTSQNVVF